MVVADDENHGQVRKRPRLSLKGKGKTSNTTCATDDESHGYQGTTPQDIGERSEEGGSVQKHDMNTSEDTADQSESFAPPEGPTVPPVSSLENLGNTCFLNSVLQILRYTPGFLEGLGELYREIVMMEQAKKLHSENLLEEDGKEPPLSMELVKQLFKLYKNMEKREERYWKIASADVTCMAVRPDRVLDIIREFNPMFEGNLQHDAQELLRCLLCYLEDAEKELHQMQTDLIAAIPISQMTVEQAPMNPIMQRFLAAGKKKTSPSSTVSQPPRDGGGDNLTKDSVKANLFNGHLADEVDGMVDVSLQGGMSQSGMCEVSSESSEATSVRKRRRSLSLPPPQQSDSKEVSGKICKESQKDIENECKQGRKRRSKSKENGLTKKDVTQNTNTAPNLSKSKRGKKKNEVLDSCEDGPKKTKLANDDKCQPSIASMFTKSSRRLGMRGRLVRKNSCTEKDNSQVCIKGEPKNMDCDSEDHSDEDEISFPKLSGALKSETPESPNKLTQDFSKISCKSPSKSPAKSHKSSPNNVRQPMLKLEKCDRVCSSPLKSVKATVAMNILCAAKRKVNFDVDEGLTTQEDSDEESLGHLKSVPVKPLLVKVEKCDPICDSPQKSVSAHLAMKYLSGHKILKMDFVEKLFQGTMMLRTRCLECEFFRERKEEFQDVSVPLRRQQEDDDEEEQDQDSDDDDSCLSKLMSAFTEVERLRDDNKYFCDMCRCYVEAERSLHYDKLPDVLTLHLKRFSAASGMFGCVSKINDHVTIPLSLPCLRYKCPKPCCRPDHRYNLYGIVTHAGVTISSGHYLAYVRVDSGSDSSQLPLANFIQSDLSPAKGESPTTTEGEPENSSVHWFECDDEAIRIHSDAQFRQCLKSESSSLLGTPYVLFYQRVTLT